MKYRSKEKMPGVEAGTIFEEIKFELVYPTVKNEHNLKSFWFAPKGQKIPIFDENDMTEDFFEPISDEKTAEEIIGNHIARGCFTENQCARACQAIDELNQAGYRIVKSSPAADTDEIEELAKKFRNLHFKPIKDDPELDNELPRWDNLESIEKGGFLCVARFILSNYQKNEDVRELRDALINNNTEPMSELYISTAFKAYLPTLNKEGGE